MYRQAGLYVRKTMRKGIVYNIYSQDFLLPWVILLPGLPQYIHKQPYLKQLIQRYSVLVPYYPGSFHSKKRFTVKNICKILSSSIDLINSGKFYDYFDQLDYFCSTEIKYVFGFSFGGNILFDYLSKEPMEDITPVFISPMFNVSNPVQLEYWQEKLGFLESDVYKSVYRGLHKNSFIKWMGLLETKSLRDNQKGEVVFGKKDRYMDASFLKDKFPAFIMEPISEYSHEVDNLMGYYVQHNLGIL